MTSKLMILLFAAILALTLAVPLPQFGGGFYRPGGFSRPGGQASAGGFSGSSNGLFGNQGYGAGFGSASGSHAAFATGYGSSSSGFGGSQGTGGGTAFGF